MSTVRSPCDSFAKEGIRYYVYLFLLSQLFWGSADHSLKSERSLQTQAVNPDLGSGEEMAHLVKMSAEGKVA